MEAVFDVKGKPFKIVCSYLGSERYYYDDELLLKRRTFKFSDRLQFDVDDSSVEIELSVSTKKVISRAYVDGEIVVHDLFPQFSKYVSEEGTKKRPSIFVTFGLWLALAIVMGFIFQGMR